MKKLFLSSIILFTFFGGGMGFFNTEVSAGFFDAFKDKKLKDLNGECLYDIDIDIDFFGGEQPVFDGPGIKRGARIARCKLDNGVSKEENLKVLIIGWTKFGLSLGALLAVVAFIYAGITYVTSFGDDSRMESAKNIMLWTVVGIVIILGAYAIVNTIMQVRFGNTPTVQERQIKQKQRHPTQYHQPSGNKQKKP